MDATIPITTDAAAVVRSLDPDAIRARVAELSREREALLVLLRAATRMHPAGTEANRPEVSRG